MSEREGSSDEAIGRPEEWREGRYQQEDRGVGTSVKPPPDAATTEPHEVESTPVTRHDYEDLTPPPGRDAG